MAADRGKDVASVRAAEPSFSNHSPAHVADDDYAADSDAHRDFLLAGAVWQDGLLQNYRLIFLTLHAILFAIGLGILAAALAQRSDSRGVVLSGILIFISLVSGYLLVTMRRIVLARGRDVNFWHRRLIKWENDFAVHYRDFTRFKIHQKAEREDSLNSIFMNGTKIDESDIDQLIEKGLGHTRRIIDSQLFNGLLVGWVLLAAGAAVNILFAAGLEVTFKA